MVKVGIIANPISARDIRRVISHAGNLPINDRANIVLRMMTGLAASGVGEVVAMPKTAASAFTLNAASGAETRLGHEPAASALSRHAGDGNAGTAPAPPA